jgi:hypothetical protein
MRRARSMYRPAATWAAPSSFGAVPVVWPPGIMIAAVAILAVWYLAKH